MGYKAQRKSFLLDFEGVEDLDGLEVRIRSTSMGSILRLAEIDNIRPSKMSTEDVKTLRSCFEIVADCMVEWNLEDDNDRPVPSTVDGLLAQDPQFVITIIKAWVRAMTGVAAPLVTPSQDGEQSLEASIPMEILSPSRAS